MRLIEHHDYVSIDFGHGRRLTTSWSGQKATGSIPKHVWGAWVGLMARKDDGRNFGERIRGFMAEIPTLWPEYADGPQQTFGVGARVGLNFGASRGGVDHGTVVKKLKTNLEVRFEKNGLVRVNPDLLVAVG